jgi:LysM repeat protein
VKPAPAPVVASTKTYTVKSGDSVSLICKRFKVSRVDLMKMNKISDANKIKIGQKLVLPGYVDLNAPRPVVRKVLKAVKPAAVAAAGGDYTVVSGDTLGGIAYRHGTTVKALKEGNSLASDKLHIGQKLALPQGSKPATQAPAADVATEEGVPAAEPGVTAGGMGEAVPVAPKSNELMHVVEPNQDLSSIAMMYGVRAEEIIRLNNLSSPDVKAGQTLKIPPPLE